MNAGPQLLCPTAAHMGPPPTLLDTFTAADGTDPTARSPDVPFTATGYGPWRNDTALMRGEISNNRWQQTVNEFGVCALYMMGPDENIGSWPAAIPSLPYFIMFEGEAVSGTGMTGLTFHDIFTLGGTGNGGTMQLVHDGTYYFNVYGPDDGTGPEYSGSIGSGGDHKIGIWVDADSSAFIADGAVLQLNGNVGSQALISQLTPELNGNASGNMGRIAVYTSLTLEQATALTT
jgi:hypothetical protein